MCIRPSHNDAIIFFAISELYYESLSESFSEFTAEAGCIKSAPLRTQLLRTYTLHSPAAPPTADFFSPLMMQNVNVTPHELEDQTEHAVTNCIK